MSSQKIAAVQPVSIPGTQFWSFPGYQVCNSRWVADLTARIAGTARTVAFGLVLDSNCTEYRPIGRMSVAELADRRACGLRFFVRAATKRLQYLELHPDTVRTLDPVDGTVATPVTLLVPSATAKPAARPAAPALPAPAAPAPVNADRAAALAARTAEIQAGKPTTGARKRTRSVAVAPPPAPGVILLAGPQPPAASLVGLIRGTDITGTIG